MAIPIVPRIGARRAVSTGRAIRPLQGTASLPDSRIQSTPVRGSRSAAHQETCVQQVASREQIEYAGVGWRFAAIAVDTVVLFFLLVAVFAVLAAAGAIDLKDPAFTGGLDLRRTAPGWMYAATYGLIFVYYTLFEALTAASVGKLVCHMRVTMDDGSRPAGRAVVVRNLVRLPEVLFWYVPAGISCLANSRNKRLGDLAAKTVVLRRTVVPSGAAPHMPLQPGPGAAPPKPAPVQTRSAQAPASGYAPPSGEASASEALAGLKTALLAVRGAHLNYLRFSEVELAKDGAEVASGHDGEPAVPAEPEYSPGYAAAWYTLADAVVAMQQAHAMAIAAATREGTDLAAESAGQPDLAYLFRELEPYFTADSDEQVHDAYMRVARGETTA
jgi:uncharacterized RDD family membrane protein YckC